MELLRVNRTIRDEALSWFFRREQVVVFEWSNPGFPKLQHALATYRIPRIRNQPISIAVLIGRALHVRLTREGVPVLSLRPTGWNSRLGSPIKIDDRQRHLTQIIFLRDLPALARVLRTACLVLPPSYICIDSARGAPVRPRIVENSASEGQRAEISATINSEFHGGFTLAK